MFKSLWVGALILGAALSAGTLALADYAAPFLEINNKIGDVSEAHGYVVATGHEDSTHFLVIVRTDTMEHIAIRATAGKDVVKESLLGRPVIIKAEVVDRKEDRDKRITVQLKLLSVRSASKEEGH